MVFASIVDMTPTKGIEINQAFIFFGSKGRKIAFFLKFGMGGFAKKREDQLSVWSRRIYVKDFS